METANKKRRMFFRGMEKVKLYSKDDPLRAFVYLAEMDKYGEFRPKKVDLYRTNEARVRILSRLGLKRRAIAFARIFSVEEDNFRGHEMLVKTLLRFHEFEEAIAVARSFAEKHIGKKYQNLLAFALDKDFERERTPEIPEKRSFTESTKGMLKILYYWIMTTSPIVQTRVWIDLHLFKMRKRYNYWRFTWMRSFLGSSKSEEPSTDLSSTEN